MVSNMKTKIRAGF